MATLQYAESARRITDAAQIATILAPLGITLQTIPVTGGRAAALLAQPQLDAEAQVALLTALDDVFQRLQREKGYQERDLVVLYPEHPQLPELNARFHRMHTHDDEEVRYIVDGEGVFGFVLEDGAQVELTVQAGDYVHIPADVEHWFRLNDAQRIKAVRYFSARGGWTPHYTDRALQHFPNP
ncbi:MULTISPECIES: cupin domain-containing protein [Acidithiobacillus]|jgi:1,2-dihydroxy-3-keto-5-methylthiopentene dioxygenase|uniref:Acireductone dioxygenase n=2 Tax=Acidithiobacillus TaxID=119977 RepID=A0A179BI45_ACIFR|nr:MULTISPECIES: cupin domain-containing protein [Acidithiobacillus]MBU2831387.1 cupin domain-containing protein [Acidithiobacillus ferriphilus]MBU2833885.1 cupin domain-containing protein [Acidithiobacillus ferriphilus]MBU2846782.1 cupin domain-containing protein [Acidithiobacillus ferriphilus]MBU2848407.1 cupin domain-containing protein [Acidithiobacillus ferriphilus]MBU2852741.1 cupin domain-containing protein [Acidithiobacillus ferriphilus]